MGRPVVWVAVLCGVLAAPADALTPLDLDRQSEPIVLTGAELPRLVGAKPGRVLAYTRRRLSFGHEIWQPTPVQIDERKRVDFGQVPEQNEVPGVEGTVYGTAPAGVTEVQYADPQTFVGADDDRTTPATRVPYGRPTASSPRSRTSC